MLFLISYRWKDHVTEAEAARALKLFAYWEPPPVTVKAHYARTDGGGVIVVETESAPALTEVTHAFVPFFEFDVTPATDITEAVPALQRVVNWRASVH